MKLHKLKINILLVLILLISINFCGCFYSSETKTYYENLLSGITAIINNEITKNYDLEILLDDIQFNSQIESLAYKKITINSIANFKMNGLFFLLKCENNCELKFSIFNGENKILEKNKILNQEIIYDVGLLFESSISISTLTEFYIEIEEQNLEEEQTKTNFVFDNVLLFIKD